MPTSTELRLKIENDLHHRYPSALTPTAQVIREVSSTNIAAIDEIIDGGFPVGAITELTGPLSSGKTTIAQSFVAGRTNDRNFCAWVDANDAFDPESAAANGVSLKHLLWVRCTNTAPTNTSSSQRSSFPKKSPPWVRLEQAIRATDLLLQAGGFAGIVLDLADESVENGRRIPLATWFRFRQAADRNRSSLIVLGKAAYAQSGAALVIQCVPDGIDTSFPNVIRAFKYCAKRIKERTTSITPINRKPPVSTWSALTSSQLENLA
jgi:hypothetical protein